MNKFKFKAWDIKNKKMLDVSSIVFYDDEDSEKDLGGYVTFDLMGQPDLEFNKQCILIPYTGFKDKNQKKIYEGNIVKSNNEFKHKWVVEFRNGSFLCKCIHSPRAFQSLYRRSKSKSLEIIGNIYENPEMLNK